MTHFFDESYYLNSKLAQLKAVHEKDAHGNDYTLDTLKQAISDAGMTPESHYQQYGIVEQLNPNPYFNEAEYLQAKLKQLQSVGETDAEGNAYTLDTLKQAIVDAGLTPAEHYEQYGAHETDAHGNLINPSNAFDANAYAAAKLYQLQTSGTAAEQAYWAEKNAADVVTAITDAGMSPVSHYEQYGAAEASASAVALVQTVPVPQRVSNDPARDAITGQNVPSNYNAPTPAPQDVHGSAAAPVTKPADVGGLASPTVSPTVVVPDTPVTVPGDSSYVAPPANLVDTNSAPVVVVTGSDGSSFGVVSGDKVYGVDANGQTTTTVIGEVSDSGAIVPSAPAPAPDPDPTPPTVYAAASMTQTEGAYTLALSGAPSGSLSVTFDQDGSPLVRQDGMAITIAGEQPAGTAALKIDLTGLSGSSTTTIQETTSGYRGSLQITGFGTGDVISLTSLPSGQSAPYAEVDTGTNGAELKLYAGSLTWNGSAFAVTAGSAEPRLEVLQNAALDLAEKSAEGIVVGNKATATITNMSGTVQVGTGSSALLDTAADGKDVTLTGGIVTYDKTNSLWTGSQGKDTVTVHTAGQKVQGGKGADSIALTSSAAANNTLVLNDGDSVAKDTNSAPAYDTVTGMALGDRITLSENSVFTTLGNGVGVCRSTAVTFAEALAEAQARSTDPTALDYYFKTGNIVLVKYGNGAGAFLYGRAAAANDDLVIDFGSNTQSALSGVEWISLNKDSNTFTLGKFTNGADTVDISQSASKESTSHYMLSATWDTGQVGDRGTLQCADTITANSNSSGTPSLAVTVLQGGTLDFTGLDDNITNIDKLQLTFTDKNYTSSAAGMTTDWSKQLQFASSVTLTGGTSDSGAGGAGLLSTAGTSFSFSANTTLQGGDSTTGTGGAGLDVSSAAGTTLTLNAPQASLTIRGGVGVDDIQAAAIALAEKTTKVILTSDAGDTITIGDGKDGLGFNHAVTVNASGVHGKLDLSASDGADTITCGSGANTIYAGGGADMITQQGSSSLHLQLGAVKDSYYDTSGETTYDTLSLSLTQNNRIEVELFARDGGWSVADFDGILTLNNTSLADAVASATSQKKRHCGPCELR